MKIKAIHIKGRVQLKGKVTRGILNDGLTTPH